MTPDWPGDTAPLPHAVAEDRLGVRLAGMVGNSAEKDVALFAVDPAVKKWAMLSDCGRYRYSLHRWWEPDRSRLGFIMLNPSTADASVDDPTIRRCLGFARTLGFDGIRVFNLYAFRATKPADLWRADDPTGGDRNDDLLREVLRQAKHQTVIAAWGANAKPERVAEVMSWRGSEHLHALGVTKDGAPRHPLYLRADARPEPWPTCVTPTEAAR